jgi:succinylglutamic semialdehyde dehydrogenase
MSSDVFINGKWDTGHGESFESLCPATGESVWQGHESTAEQVNAAIAAARAAQPKWAATPLAERIAILERYAENLTASKEAIAYAISRDMGKPLWEALTEVGAMAAKIGHSIRAQAERAGDRDEGALTLTHRPHGVMAVFGPFNFPGHLPNGHIVPALLAGNCCVFKPSELTPAVASLMVEAFEKAGLPAGCLNVIQGGRETGQALLNGDINGLLFTGSAKTGTAFHKHFAGRPNIILALEMGGNNPLIAWDGDRQAVADIAFFSAYISAGQRCTCARRLILPEGAFGDDVLGLIQSRIREVSVGHWDQEVFMGPVVSEQSAMNARHFQAALIKAGGETVVPIKVEGAFVHPGLMEMSSAKDVEDEELFGPLLQVYRVKNFDAAIAKANETRFGLSGGLLSENKKLWEQAGLQMKAGILNWNKPTTGAASSLPFGGPGLSGNFRPGAYYAADYCAWPQAGQVADTVSAPAMKGF